MAPTIWEPLDLLLVYGVNDNSLCAWKPFQDRTVHMLIKQIVSEVEIHDDHQQFCLCFPENDYKYKETNDSKQEFAATKNKLRYRPTDLHRCLK